MPLKDLIPVIDDRSFEDLVEEARVRIPRYTPEWTDTNESDPGFALVQLFAWLTEMQLYRISRVPLLNQIKLLELVGVELESARPARAQIGFAVRKDFAEPWVDLPPGTQVSTEEPDDQGPIVFETERALTVVAARLDRLLSSDGYTQRDLTTQNASGKEGFLPFGKDPGEDAALLFAFDHGQPIPSLQLDLTFWSADAATKGQRCGSARSQGQALTWEYLDADGWRPLALLDDQTEDLTRSGHCLLKTPATGEMAHRIYAGITEARYWIRVRLARPDQKDRRLLAVRTNTVGAVQAQTLSEEVLGTSNGRPHQDFRLANAPVLDKSLRLEVDEGQGFKTWQEVPDLFASGREDPHYCLDRTTGEVRFGDGEHGRIPGRTQGRGGRNILARAYRFGGGTRGNLASGQLTRLMSTVTGIDLEQVTNLMASQGGREEEDLDGARRRLPQLLKTRNRAVTTEDFEALAREAANVRRAKALPRRHPDFPGTEVPGSVTLILVPDEKGPAPVPDAETLRQVCAYLDQRRLLTTELHLVAPRYHQVRIQAEVIAEPTADQARIRLNAEQALKAYLDPLTGGDDGKGWPFGGDVHYSLVSHRIQRIQGVRRILHLTIHLDGEAVDECKDAVIGAGALVYSGKHQVLVSREEGGFLS